MKSIIRLIALQLIFLATILSWSTAQAANPSISISPSGMLTTVARLPVIISLDNPDNYRNLGLSVALNGNDLSSLFNSAAAKSTSGSLATYRVEYVFQPGTYTITATASLLAPDGITMIDIHGSTQFTIPQDQTQRKSVIIADITTYLQSWDGYDFRRWINPGGVGVFSARANDAEFQVYVDPAYLAAGGNAAEYVEAYYWKYIIPVYIQDLVLADEPQNVVSVTLWHEMVHAVSHGAQLAHAPNALDANDHIYLGWAQGCMFGWNKLRSFEYKAKGYGIGNPTDLQAADARKFWKDYVTEMKHSDYAALGDITVAQQAQFQNLFGFVCPDINAMKQDYLGIGYSPKYFNDVNVTITSPSTGTQTNENQVKVEANFTNNEPSLTVDKVGFSVNGAIQEAPRAGNTFGTTAVLKTGDNSIIAGVMTTDGQIFQSTPITVKSNALNNTYHAQITWDKNDTDIDLHFSWSGGSECFYSNKTPTWGSAATSPRLDVDNTHGFGPENITIGGLPGSGAYALSVRYYSDHGNGPTTVYASIYKDGVSIFSNSRTMSNGENWTLYQFTIP